MQHTPVSQSTFPKTVSTITHSVYSPHSQAPMTGNDGSKWQTFDVTSCSPTSPTPHLVPKPKPQYAATSGLPMGNVSLRRSPVSHLGHKASQKNHYMHSPASFPYGGFQPLHNQGGLRFPTAEYAHPVSSDRGLPPRQATSNMMDADNNRRVAESNTMVVDSNTNTPGFQDMHFPCISKTRKRGKPRTPYTVNQKLELEAVFFEKRYLDPAERTALAQRTGLSDRQVKIWFQNRRTKLKKSELSRLREHVMLGTTLSTPQSPPQAAGTRLLQFRPVATAFSTSAASGPSSAAVSSD